MSQQLWLMSMNLSHEVDIDESTPMGQYQQINTDGSISTKQH